MPTHLVLEQEFQKQRLRNDGNALAVFVHHGHCTKENDRQIQYKDITKIITPVRGGR
jgi:hypothetical protein